MYAITDIWFEYLCESYVMDLPNSSGTSKYFKD